MATPRVENTVFISYRRTNFAWAMLVFQHLKARGYDVFIDYVGLASGDFATAILENITSRAHFLVLLTPSALEMCSKPGDWLRREIEIALESKRNIVPLTLEGFSFGAPAIADQLTGKLALLKGYQAVSVPNEYFEAAMDRLRTNFLNVPLAAVIHPASPAAQQVAQEQKAAASTDTPTQKQELTAQQYFEQAFSSKDPAEKIRLYSEAIRLKPDYAEAFNNRAAKRADSSDFNGALADANEAIRLKPDYADAYINRGVARDGNGDYAGALVDYTEAIRLRPDSAIAHSNRGNVRKRKGDVEGAMADYDEAIRLSPNYALAFFNRGLAWRTKGDNTAALADYTKAIQLNPDYAPAFDARGIARQQSGDSTGALADYAEAIRLRPDVPSAYYNRGIARKAMGDVDGALSDYTQAIHLKPDYAYAYYNRGLAYRELKWHSSAIADFQKYLELGVGARDGDTSKIEKMIREMKEKAANT